MSEKHLHTFRHVFTRFDFNTSQGVNINAILDVPWHALEIKSATLISIGSRIINKPFIVDERLVYYSNKDRKCCLRFAKGGLTGALDVKRDDVDTLTIEFTVEINNKYIRSGS